LLKSCACFDSGTVDGERTSEDLRTVRDSCVALRNVLLPNSVWPKFRDWHSRPDNVAWHCSIVFLAFRQGYLGRVTSAVHRYLISEGELRSDVRKQYLQDLREKWMLYPDPVERHQKARMFQSRLAELQCAEWLETQGHKVVGLEALTNGPDIETVSANLDRQVFEVKFIGTEDADLSTILLSIAGKRAADWVSPYTAANYLVFRTYEAAKQLESVVGGKTAVLIIDESAWWRFDMPLRDGWIDWRKPEFIGQDSDWDAFLNKQKTRYADIPGDLASAISVLDTLWIVKQKVGFDFEYVSKVAVRIA
jgi:hypothetical protein